MSDLTFLSQRGQITAQLTRFPTYLRTNSGDDKDIDLVKMQSKAKLGRVPERATADRRRG